MTPDEIRLRDAFLQECWPVVREYHDAPDIPIPSPLPVRTRGPQERCPICGRRYAADRLADHVIDRHPESLDDGGLVAL